MSDYQNSPQANTYDGRAQDLAIDQGLRSYMVSVYNLMALGVAFTAIVAMSIMNMPSVLHAISGRGMHWVFFIGILALGWFSPKLIFSGNRGLAHAAYWGYALLWGLAITPMIYMFFRTGQEATVVRALGITAITFGALSLYGYTTKRNLSAFATFFFMASIGLILAMIANALFFQSSIMSLIVSCGVVLVFSGVTAWETQEIKQMYYAADSQGVRSSKAIFGAFLLYGSFVTLFINILNILGIMGDE